MRSQQCFLFLLLVFCCTIADARNFVSTDIIVTEYVVVKSPKLKSNELCGVCENFTTQAIDYMAANRTQEEIIETLHHACSQIKSFEQQCITLVDYYALLFFNEISKVNPEDFCKEVNLCESSLTYYKNALPITNNGNSTCEFCRHLIEEILAKLKDPDSQFEILELLLKECSKVQSHEKECKRLVLQYTPLILVNGEKFLEKNDICGVVRACDVTKNPSIESVVSENSKVDA